MSHDLDSGNGKFSMASRRLIPWHNLGEVFTEDKTAKEMLAAAHLANWKTRGIAMSEFLADTNIGVSVDKQVIIRDNPFYDEDSDNNDVNKYDMLGVVGERYNIVQNEELFEFGDALLQYNGRWETAGAIRRGTHVFGSLAMETEIVIDPNGVDDKIKQYLLLSNRHDGSGALIAAQTDVRVVCKNTYDMAMGGLTNTIKIRHTRSAQERMREAIRVREMQVKRNELFQADANLLFEKTCTDAEFFEIVNSLYEKPESKSGITRWNNKVGDIMTLWNSETQAGTKNTAWGALGALTEDAQWNRQINKNNMENFFSAGSGFDAIAKGQRQNIFDTVKAFATA